MINANKMKDGKKSSSIPVNGRLKYKIAKSTELGRYLMAAKDLVAGEVIHREYPVAVGPATFYKGSICFNCLKPIVLRKAKDPIKCTRCKVAPLCHSACESYSGYHKDVECQLFRRNQSELINISEHIAVLLPLRVWLLRESEPEVWTAIESMEDHMKERLHTSIWHERNEKVVQVLQKFHLIPNDDETSKLIQRICGILDVNSFELRSSDDSEFHLLRGIYREAALVTHDCRGNTHFTVDDKHHLTIHASLPIKKGAVIYFNYTGALLGTAERRENLRKGKYFECECMLCRDPYELGSNLSSLVCPRCRRGYVAIQNSLTTNPYSLEAKWQCERCKSLLSGKMIKTMLDIILSHIQDSENMDTKIQESLLQKLYRNIHTNHYLALELKKQILGGYRKELSTMNPKKNNLKRILKLCEEILVVLDITEPGISRLKGITLYEMHLSSKMLANKDYNARQISAAQFLSQLEDAETLIRKALSNLLLEPATTPEGRLAKRALQELKILRQNIVDAKALAMEGSRSRIL